MTTRYEKFPAARLHPNGTADSTPNLVPSAHDPAIAQPVILTPADALPTSLTRVSLGSPTTLYLNMSSEEDYCLSDKRRREEDDEFNPSKFAHIDSPSSSSSSHDEDVSDDLSSVSRKPGRKPMPDDDTFSHDSEHDPKVKRKAQNRAAQRAFRERKERYVKELEAKIKQMQDNHFHASAQLVQENQHLRSVVYRLEAENFALKGIHVQFPIHPSPYLMYTPPGSTTEDSSAAGLKPTSHPHYHQPLLAPAAAAVLQPPSHHHHQQQYTFSISTPATLRPKKTTAESTTTITSAPSTSQEYFCQMLQSQVSNNVIERLLSEPLFDTTGSLIQHEQERQQGAVSKSSSCPAPEGSAVDSMSALRDSTARVLTPPEIWQHLSRHERFSSFTVEELCDQVSRYAKSTDHGPTMEEHELHAVLRDMDLAERP